jgi:alkylation response protein AidB-like acyl-CoA dehydrogenase
LVTTDFGGGRLDVKPHGAERLVHGVLRSVPDADLASHILVWGGKDDVCGLVALDDAKVQRAPRRTWDETRPLFEVKFEGAALTKVLALGEAATDLQRRAEEHMLQGVAADSLGAASALLDLTVEYLQTRRQFERPLAMFQALKHRCADLAAMIAASEALLRRSARGTSSEPLDAVLSAGLLKSQAASVFHTVAEEAIQLHGGIGLTAEHSCHLFFKRATLNGALAGEGDLHETRAGEAAIPRLARC